MKAFNKSEFWFLNDDGSKKEPKSGECYFNEEWRLSLKFPFLRKEIIMYQLFDDFWIERV